MVAEPQTHPLTTYAVACDDRVSVQWCYRVGAPCENRAVRGGPPGCGRRGAESLPNPPQPQLAYGGVAAWRRLSYSTSPWELMVIIFLILHRKD